MRRLVPILALFSLLGPARARAADYGLFAAAHLGYGHLGADTSGMTQTRSMGTIDLQAMPGLKFYGKSVLAGLLFDFRMLTQLSNADKAAIGDFGGTGLTLGPGVVLDFSAVRLLLSYDLRDRLSTSSSLATLKGSGFHVLLGYKYSPKLTLDLEYVVAKYNSYSTGADDRDIDPVISHKNIGLGASFLF